MAKEYIKIKYIAPRMEMESVLKSFVESKWFDEWKKGEIKYPTFYESVIEPLWPDDPEDAEENRNYYRGFTYNDEELDKVIAYTNSIKDWDDNLYEKASEYRRINGGNLDYIYLTDERLPEMQAGARELYDLMIANDEKYDFDRSYKGAMTEDDWYDRD